MPPSSLDVIARAIANALHCDHRAFCLQILRLLANGQPVSSEQLATTLDMSSDDITAILRQLPDIEYNREGNIVASGLSLLPTQHHFQVNGHALFTWCAMDALTYPMMLQQPAYVESPCPVTGASINLQVSPERVEFFEPDSAVISFVLPEKARSCCNVRDSFCCNVLFFSTLQAASEWRSDHQEMIVLPVDEAYQVARMVARYRFGEVLPELRIDDNML
jgi:alkylmercury lyase